MFSQIIHLVWNVTLFSLSVCRYRIFLCFILLLLYFFLLLCFILLFLLSYYDFFLTDSRGEGNRQKITLKEKCVGVGRDGKKLRQEEKFVKERKINTQINRERVKKLSMCKDNIFRNVNVLSRHQQFLQETRPAFFSRPCLEWETRCEAPPGRRTCKVSSATHLAL